MIHPKDPPRMRHGTLWPWLAETEFEMAFASEMLMFGFRIPRSRYGWIDRTCSEPKILAYDQIVLLTQVSGDVATNIAVAQACILQRKWDRAAELYLLAFALVVLAPWTDCLTLPLLALVQSCVFSSEISRLCELVVSKFNLKPCPPGLAGQLFNASKL